MAEPDRPESGKNSIDLVDPCEGGSVVNESGSIVRGGDDSCGAIRIDGSERIGTGTGAAIQFLQFMRLQKFGKYVQPEQNPSKTTGNTRRRRKGNRGMAESFARGEKGRVDREM
jgi:hypothetical protein